MHLGSDGEGESEIEHGNPVPRHVPSESDEENDPDDFGYYDGTNKFFILVRRPQAPGRRSYIPTASKQVPGALDVYTQGPAFRLLPHESKVVYVGCGLVIPRGHVAVFSSRSALIRTTGVECPQVTYGPGECR